jgi:hypothetical protein
MRRNTRHIILAIVGIAGSLALTMCGGGGGETTSGTTTTNCPNGICGSGGKTTTSETTVTGGGGSTSTTSSSSSGSTTSSSSSTSSGGCVEAWLCTPWDTGGNGNAATRTCTDMNNCGTTANKPVESTTLPSLDLNYFKCNVEPILDKKCGMIGCHGTETGRALRVYARGRLREANSTITSAFCAGSSAGSACYGANSCPCNGAHTAIEWQRNYDSARGFGLDEQGNAVGGAQSDLIQQAVVGGKAHAGIHLFKNGDADYATIVSWVDGATLATCNTGNN